MQGYNRPNDQQLAFAWHVAEFLGVMALIGLIWSWRHLTPTTTETSYARANRGRDL
jgi:hypothetical protein